MATPIGGLDLQDLDSITTEEVNAYLSHSWRARGSLYVTYANSLMADYTPKIAKLHKLGSGIFGSPSPVNIFMMSAQNMHSYMMLGWETGIRNEFIVFQQNGVSKEQVMELVMFSQLYAGIRGLGHVYRAVGDFLPAWQTPQSAVVLPEGWEPDPDAFKSGLDLSTREMTDRDVKNLTSWYEGTIGYLPKSIQFGLKYHPEFVKVNRAKWEVAIRTLPKQVAPFLMLRHNTITQSVEGLRESALLAKAWGVSKDLVIHGITMTSFYFAGFEGLYAPHEALDDILANWD